MGNIGTKKAKILMLGLDSAGKSSILRTLNVGQINLTNKAFGWDIESVEYGNISWICWDLGGSHKLHALFKVAYRHSDALVFVINSSDRYYMHGFHQAAKSLLHDLLKEEELKDPTIPLLLLANKHDLPHAMDIFKILQVLELEHICIDREWRIQACCATTGAGLYDGLDWLSQQIGHTLYDKKRDGSDGQDGRMPGIDKKTHYMILENRVKSILFVCGWIRKQNDEHQLNVLPDVAQLIHRFYQHTKHDESYPFQV